jgi:hypothetical protein
VGRRADVVGKRSLISGSYPQTVAPAPRVANWVAQGGVVSAPASVHAWMDYVFQECVEGGPHEGPIPDHG